jgi:hypothetical protein
MACPFPLKNQTRMGDITCMGTYSLPSPLSAFKNCLKQMEKMLAFVGGAKVVFIIPLPWVRPHRLLLIMGLTACPENSLPSFLELKKACQKRPPLARGLEQLGFLISLASLVPVSPYPRI